MPRIIDFYETEWRIIALVNYCITGLDNGLSRFQHETIILINV